MTRGGPTNRTAAELARDVVWSQRRRLGLGFLLLLLDRAAGLVLPFAPKLLVDEVIGRRRTELLPWIGAAVVASAIVQATAAFALTRILGLSAERVVLLWRRRLMARVTWLPLARIDEAQTGALATRVMDDAASLQNLVGWELVRWVSNVLTAAVALVALFFIDWRITLAALAFASIPALGFNLSHRRLRPLFQERSRARAEVQGRLQQTLAGMRVVKAYAAEKREQIVFTRGLHRLFRVLSQTTTRKSAMNALATVVVAGVVAIVLVLGGKAILAGRLSLGDFGSYVAFALMLGSPLLDLPEIATRVSETLADLDRVQELEAMAPELEGDDGREPLATARGDVTFDRVGFEYVPGVPVLEDVSFVAPAGTTIAVVGPSGAGKSTLLSLLMGFHRPTTGRILVDGRDLADVRLRDYRKLLGVVLQDEYLFDATVADNIAFGRPRATRAEIERASRLAHCEEFVRTLPDGLDTMVGERGVKLSGGQRQRVAIARAILADARILVLDEATSSLDSESEAAIRDALSTLREGRTSFVIAHRLSTIRSADLILVLERGKVAERGTHEELLARPSRYRVLHEAQFGGATRDI